MRENSDLSYVQSQYESAKEISFVIHAAFLCSTGKDESLHRNNELIYIAVFKRINVFMKELLMGQRKGEKYRAFV